MQRTIGTTDAHGQQARHRMIRALAWTAASFGMLYICAGVALFVFQRSLIFMNDRTDVAPAEVGLPRAEIHRLTAADGVDLVSWLVRVNSDRLVIYFHGNGGPLAARAETIQGLTALGVSVLALEYRGYGGSAGSPSEAGLLLDAEAAYDFVRRLGYSPERVILYGESLGTGVAVALAARREVAGLILDSPFSSIADVAAARYWMFPVRFLLRDRFRSDLAIGKIKAPILMLHGTADEVVPLRFGQLLFARAGANAMFVPIDGADHVVFDDSIAQASIKAWLSGHFRTGHERRPGF